MNINLINKGGRSILLEWHEIISYGAKTGYSINETGDILEENTNKRYKISLIDKNLLNNICTMAHYRNSEDDIIKILRLNKKSYAPIVTLLMDGAIRDTVVNLLILKKPILDEVEEK
jgi:hypothetical protein